MRSLLALVLLLALLQPAAFSQNPRGEEWREDLRHLRTELEARHADLYHSITSGAFGEAAARLERRIPQLSDEEIVVALARLTASVGDGHTGLFLPWGRGFDFSRLPLDFYYGEDGYFILAAAPEYAELVGARLLRIGETPVEEVVEHIIPLLPRDNRYALRSFAGTYLRLAELLKTLGFVGRADVVPILVEDADGQQRSVDIRPLAGNASFDWTYVRSQAHLPLYLRHRDVQYWFEHLPDTRTVFLQFNSADISEGDDEAAFAAFADSLVAFIDAHAVERLVIDLRWNSGGSFTRTRHLLWAAIRSEKVNRRGRLFVIIGPDTFSAATALATELDQHTHALFVGRPTGGRPNSFGDLGRILLPNSQIEVWYSRWAMHQSLPGDHRPAIFPDLRAPLTVEAYRSNRDPAMEAIAAYQPRTPIIEVLGPVLAEAGVEAALERYRRLREEAFNRYDFGEPQLNTLGYELLAQGRAEAALEVFRLNAELFPYSPDSYDSLADAYRELGMNEAAIENYLRAFRIDKQYSHSWEAARSLQDERQ